MDAHSILQNYSDSISSPPLLFLIAIITFFVSYITFQLYPQKGKNFPPGSLGLPFVGESLSFLKAQKEDKTTEWLSIRVKKHGPVFKTSLFGSKVVAITGQEGNKFMFSGGDNGIESKLPVSSVKLLGKYTIFEVSGTRHKLVRSAMMTYLKPESIQKFVGQMDSMINQQLMNEINGADSVQVVKMVKKITFNVASTLLFGLKEGTGLDTHYEDFLILFKGVWSVPLNLPFTTFGKSMKARHRIHNYLSKLINEKRTGLETGKISPHHDIIASLVSLRDENGKALKEEEIIDNLITLVIASTDTSAIVLIFFIRHLARDAEVCAKVLGEQKEVLKAKEGDDGTIGWSEIQMMKYTWRVAQELMRIYPPVFGNFKSTSRDTSFADFHIPKGWQVFWASSPTHMDKQYFDEPNNFDPSRFENQNGSIPSYVYIPFGAGQRICPGSEFARIEVLLIIHHMVTKYQWTEMIPNERITRNPMPYPAMGMPVKIHLRKNKV